MYKIYSSLPLLPSCQITDFDSSYPLLFFPPPLWTILWILYPSFSLSLSLSLSRLVKMGTLNTWSTYFFMVQIPHPRMPQETLPCIYVHYITRYNCWSRQILKSKKCPSYISMIFSACYCWFGAMLFILKTKAMLFTGKAGSMVFLAML